MMTITIMATTSTVTMAGLNTESCGSRRKPTSRKAAVAAKSSVRLTKILAIILLPAILSDLLSMASVEASPRTPGIIVRLLILTPTLRTKKSLLVETGSPGRSTFHRTACKNKERMTADKAGTNTSQDTLDSALCMLPQSTPRKAIHPNSSPKAIPPPIHILDRARLLIEFSPLLAP
jgi:hypothetical protein